VLAKSARSREVSSTADGRDGNGVQNIITAELNGKGYECFLPLHKTRRRWSGRFKESEQHTHLSLATDSPEPRRIPSPEFGKVIEQPQVGGLHHRYERRAAESALARDRLPLHLLAWKNLRLRLSVASAVT